MDTFYILPFFGQIDTANLTDYYLTECEYNGTMLRLDLNFEHLNVSIDRLDVVKKLLDNIPMIDAKNKYYIAEDFNSVVCGEVREYINHHMDELNPEDLQQLVSYENQSLSAEEQLLKRFELVRIGFYPQDEHFMILDYSIGTDFTQYLLAMYNDENADIIQINWES